MTIPETQRVSPPSILVTVIVPAFNFGHLIHETLDNLLEQTLTDWECLIIDDGSTDNTKNVVESYLKKDSRFKYIYQDNKGLSGARNIGIINSNGKYIQFLDADDLLQPRKLEIHAAYLDSHSDIDIVYSEARYFYSNKPNKKLYYHRAGSRLGGAETWMPKISGTGKRILNVLYKKNIMAVNCALIRREVFENVGLQDEQLRSREDWEFWFRCAGNKIFFQFLDNPETYALVRAHTQSMSNDVRAMLIYEKMMLKKNYMNCKDYEIRLQLYKRYGYRIGTIAIEEFKLNNIFTGFKNCFEALWITKEVKWFLYAFIGLISPRVLNRVVKTSYKQFFITKIGKFS